MSVKLGPAGVPLSCKGRTIVEGMDDIISLGLETMEVQTVRLVSPQHFEQYWQAGVLANKTNFEMNLHGPYYSELLGDKLQRNRSLAKVEAALQTAKTINARHITLHVGHYAETGRGHEANEQVASVFNGIVQRINDIWNDDDEMTVAVITMIIDMENVEKEHSCSAGEFSWSEVNLLVMVSTNESTESLYA